MPAVVARRGGEGWRLEGSWPDVQLANRFLAHLTTRAFSPATVRAYAYDLVNFGRFCVERGVSIADAVATDFFDYLDWQIQSKPSAGAKVVRLADRRGLAPATSSPSAYACLPKTARLPNPAAEVRHSSNPERLRGWLGMLLL